MWELDYKGSWALKNYCFWTVVLEKTLESPLDCREIQSVHPKGNQCWIFIGKTDAKAETITLATWNKELTHWKTPWCWERLKAGREDEMAGWHHQLNGHESEKPPGVSDGQGGLACCSPWGRKESDTTEWLNWTEGAGWWDTTVPPQTTPLELPRLGLNPVPPEQGWNVTPQFSSAFPRCRWTLVQLLTHPGFNEPHKVSDEGFPLWYIFYSNSLGSGRDPILGGKLITSIWMIIFWLNPEFWGFTVILCADAKHKLCLLCTIPTTSQWKGPGKIKRPFYQDADSLMLEIKSNKWPRIRSGRDRSQVHF